MNSLTAFLACVLSLFVCSVHGAEPTFAGEWDTTYGRMILKVDGAKVSGTYHTAGEEPNEISGVVDGRKFAFNYAEPNVQGEGSFTLSDDGMTFDGRWRPQGREPWNAWSGRRAPAVKRDFSGVWKTTYGMMRLVQKDDKVEGCYTYNGRSTVSGTVKGAALKLTYREPDGTTGKAEFALEGGNAAFSGPWKPDTSAAGGTWTGTRIDPQPARVWLVILEARWEASLRDAEYSYGDMLRQFFTRVPTVACAIVFHGTRRFCEVVRRAAISQ